MENPPINHKRKVIHRPHGRLWQMYLGVLIVIALQALTDSSFLPFSKLWLVGIEVLLLLDLIIISGFDANKKVHSRRSITILLVAVIATINVFSLLMLMYALFGQHVKVSGHELLINGLIIYITNIFMFALWYWEMDGGGPEKRSPTQAKRDFIFPQMIHTKYGENWLPSFTDYAYLSTTNVTNFASADTMPISHRAKLLMMLQSLVAVITVVLVLARAISILQ